MSFTHFSTLYALLVLMYLTRTTSGCFDAGIKIKEAVESEDLTDIFENYCKQYVGHNVSLNDQAQGSCQNKGRGGDNIMVGYGMNWNGKKARDQSMYRDDEDVSDDQTEDEETPDNDTIEEVDDTSGNENQGQNEGEDTPEEGEDEDPSSTDSPEDEISGHDNHKHYPSHHDLQQQFIFHQQQLNHVVLFQQ
ncbi:hypothetical protein SLS64_009238 [Diaporthe eres]|uniref:Uncharacterized protein n=1 Tax=Diaporthe eres TaxID=83184 RepID=A0ABR1NQX6_DIAER